MANEIGFDVAYNNLGTVCQDLQNLAAGKDRKMAVTIQMVGPAGGNPFVKVVTSLGAEELLHAAGIKNAYVNGDFHHVGLG